jgi:dethiobiotin synthetase
MHSVLSTQYSALFITGTDTSVGKSIFTATLSLSILNEGKKVAISKPIQTGKPRDTDLLQKLTENKISVFNTYSFELPAAPSVAAKHENKEIDIEKVISNIKKLEKEFDIVIVEGIGGIAVPIVGADLCVCPNSYLVADLIKDLNYPTIIVARPILGTINHTVLTIEFAKQKKLNILGFVISGYDENTKDSVIKTAPDVISYITGVKCLMKLPILEKMRSFISTTSTTSSVRFCSNK